MFKLIMTLTVGAGALLGAGSLAGAAGGGATSQHQPPALIAVLGPPVSVPAGKFVKAFAYCPKGYLVTGGGAYSGAVTEIVSSPTPDLHGWFVDGTNHDRAGRTFQHRADAVCVQAKTATAIATAASASPVVRQAEAEFAASHPAAGTAGTR